MEPPELEREIHEALRRLPPLRAPRSLTPRVMAAVRARREAPWHARPMTTWPLGLQVLATVLVLLPVALLGLWSFGGGVVRHAVTALGVPESAGMAELLPPSIRQMAEQWSAIVVLWRLLLAPVLMYAAAFAVAFGCLFAVCAAAVTRVVLGRAPA